MHKWFYSGKVNVFGIIGCIQAKVVVFGQCDCIRAMLLYLGKVAVFCHK